MPLRLIYSRSQSRDESPPLEERAVKSSLPQFSILATLTLMAADALPRLQAARDPSSAARELSNEVYTLSATATPCRTS